MNSKYIIIISFSHWICTFKDLCWNKQLEYRDFSYELIPVILVLGLQPIVKKELNNFFGQIFKCLLTSIDAFWLNNAQQSGVANVRQNPQNKIWIGEFDHGKRLNTPRLSRNSVKTGVKTKKLKDKKTIQHI